MGPTARSHVASPSTAPPSVSWIVATGPTPFRGGPWMEGSEYPSDPSTEPAYLPWSDSTRPIPASRVHRIPQAGSSAATTAAACR